MNYFKRLFKKWEVIYTFRTQPPFVMKYRSGVQAEKDALYCGFKLMQRSKMEVNYLDKTITIS